MIVWVASYPRSGNRLCRVTIRQAFGQVTGVATPDGVVGNRVDRLLRRMGIGPGDDPWEALEQWERPVFLKTHRLPQRLRPKPNAGEERSGKKRRRMDDGNRAIYIVRDGRDCMVSYAHFRKEVEKRPEFESMSEQEAIAALMSQRKPYTWSEHVRVWRERAAPTAVVRFEELVGDPVGVIGHATDELGVGLPPPDREAPSFEWMKQRNPRVVRRGKTGGWRSSFPPDLLDRFWEEHGEQMQAMGYSRE